MANSANPLADLFATLKGYINQLSDGQRSPAEVGSALNEWARESAESIRAKISEEVEATVSKMGFIKREEYDLLAKRVAQLEKSQKSDGKERRPQAKKRTVKKSTTQKSAEKKR